MEAFNIFKPDMVIDQKLVDNYINMIAAAGISILSAYYIHDWITIAKQIYEADVCNCELCQEEICSRRRQLLTTIKAYQLYYPNKAAVVLYDINDLLAFNQLKELKRQIRQQHVYNSPKCYLKFNGSPIDYSLPLDEIDISEIDAEAIVIPNEYDFSDASFSMAFFNRLHLPDQGRINNELALLKKNNVFTEENRILRLSK